MLIDRVLDVHPPLRLLWRLGPVAGAVGADAVCAVAGTGQPAAALGRPRCSEGEIAAIFLAGDATEESTENKKYNINV